MASSPRTRLRIAISAGDPNGIGPEVVLRCLAAPAVLEAVDPVIIGKLEVLQAHARAAGLDAGMLRAMHDVGERTVEGRVPVLDASPGHSCPVVFGEIRADGGLLAMRSVERAVRGCLDGLFDAMVTAPISKEAIALAGYEEPGHTEFIARLAGGRPLMMLVAGGLRVALVTAHVPLRDVADRVTEPSVFDRLKDLDTSLRRDFGIGQPRITVLGLNPHAGDGGVLGDEEQRHIEPAVRAAAAAGVHASGPFPADGFFAARSYDRYDAVLAMYHDQGLAPFKTLSFGRGVNFTAGLEVVRSSPDHGTAYDIAGAGRASADSMRAAIDLAVEVAVRRRTPDQNA